MFPKLKMWSLLCFEVPTHKLGALISTVLFLVRGHIFFCAHSLWVYKRDIFFLVLAGKTLRSRFACGRPSADRKLHVDGRPSDVLTFLIGTVISMGKGEKQISLQTYRKSTSSFSQWNDCTYQKSKDIFFLKGAWGRKAISVIFQLKPSFTYFR